MNDDSPTTKDRAWQGYAQVALVALVLLGGFAMNYVLSSSSPAPAASAATAAVPVVEVIQPKIEDVTLQIRESGTIVARNNIQLSPQVGGRVTAVSPNLASGGYFTANEVLFELDPADYQSAVNRAQAERSAALADLSIEQAEARVAEQEWALVHPDEPIPDLVARIPQIARAEAALESAEAALSDARLSLSRVRFALPFAGRILSTTIEIGQNLSPGQSYGLAYDPGEIEINVAVTTTALDALNPAVGRPAQVIVGRAGTRGQKRFEARVIRADAELNTQTRLANLTLAFTEPTAALPGEFVNVEILGPRISDAYLLPERAMTEGRSIWVVESGQLVKRTPPVLYIRNQEIVTAPFDVADGVVVSPLIDPSPGLPVRMRSVRDNGLNAS